MSGMVMGVHSMVLSAQLLCFRPHLRTQSKVPSLLDSLHRLYNYSAVSRVHTISASIACQWHGGVPWDRQDSRPCTTRTHLSCVPIREAKQLHRDFHLNAWIRVSIYMPPMFMPRTNIAFAGSTRALNSLNLIGKPMMLINTQLSFTITAMAVAILM